jgi:hypothetical protein
VRILDRDTIKALDDRRITPVPVPAWGGVVHVRTLSVGEREEVEEPALNSGTGRATMRGYRARVVVAAAVNEDGTQMFQPDDVGWLQHKAAGAVEVIAEAAMGMNGMTDSAVPDAAGNSDGDPRVASFTGSPSPAGDPWPRSEQD